MDSRLEHSLRARYPALTSGLQICGGHAFDAYGFQCNDGWFPLLVELLGLLDDARVRSGSEITLLQVKEKLAELRIYRDDAGVEEGAEEKLIFDSLCRYLSRHICEVCGQPGAVRRIASALATTCEMHAESFVSVPGGEQEERVSRFLRYDREGIETRGLLYVEADRENYPPNERRYLIFEFPDRIVSAREHSLKQQLTLVFNGSMGLHEAHAYISSLEQQDRLINPGML